MNRKTRSIRYGFLGVKGKCQGESELTVGAAVRPSEIQALP